MKTHSAGTVRRTLWLEWSVFGPLHRAERLFAVLLVLGALAVALLSAWRASANLDPYAVGDWLINYRGGIVRRGLVGELLLLARDLTGLRLEWLTFIVKVACCLILYFTAAWLLWSVKGLTRAHALVLLSPAVLLFYSGGGRKELLLFAWVALLLLRKAADQLRPDPGYAELAVGWALLTASHEGLLFYWPQFVLLLYMLGPRTPYEPLKLLASVSPAMLIFAVVTPRSPFVKPDVAAICAALRESTPKNCATPLYSSTGWLIAGLDEGVASVAQLLTPAAVFNGAIALALSIGFIFYVALRDRAFAVATHARRQQLWLLALMSIVCLLTLFVIAPDWGRWIHIAATLLACGTIGHVFAHPSERDRTYHATGALGTAFLSLCALAFAGAYVFAWEVPHCCVAGAWFSWPIRHGLRFLGL